MGKCRELGQVIKLIEAGHLVSARAVYIQLPMHKRFSPKTIRKWLRDDPPTRRTVFARMIS